MISAAGVGESPRTQGNDIPSQLVPIKERSKSSSSNDDDDNADESNQVAVTLLFLADHSRLYFDFNDSSQRQTWSLSTDGFSENANSLGNCLTLRMTFLGKVLEKIIIRMNQTNSMEASKRRTEGLATYHGDFDRVVVALFEIAKNDQSIAAVY